MVIKMWPFPKKDNLNLDALEKELNANSSAQRGDGLNIQQQENAFPEEEDDGFAKTTKDERYNMAKSFSNSNESVMMPSNQVPIGDIGGSQNYTSGYEQNSSSHQSSGDVSHKVEIMEKQVEILSSKIDLLKVNMEAISSKLAVIDQKIDKKINSW